MEPGKNRLGLGIALMIGSALFTCFGQLGWKLSANGGAVVFLIAGFALYGCGALLMMIAMRFGELSVLHPMLSSGYILSIVLGFFVLGEDVSARKIVGIAVIIAGLVCLSTSGRRKQ